MHARAARGSCLYLSGERTPHNDVNAKGVFTGPRPSFCHALPQTWHLMSVMLNAAGCLDFTAQLAGYDGVAALLDDAETHTHEPPVVPALPERRARRTTT